MVGVRILNMVTHRSVMFIYSNVAEKCNKLIPNRLWLVWFFRGCEEK